LFRATRNEDSNNQRKQPASSIKTLRRTSAPKSSKVSRNAMRVQYRFDYGRAKPNRFAAEMSEGVIAVVLDPDVAVVFKSSDAVNALLRLVISAMP
jgi:hypothetical protein